MKIKILFILLIVVNNIVAYSQYSGEVIKCYEKKLYPGNFEVYSNSWKLLEDYDYYIDYDANCVHIVRGCNDELCKNVTLKYISNVISDIPERYYIDFHSYGGWYLSSLPQKQPDLFPESELIDSIGSGFNRAKLAWYSIDPIFLRNNSSTPTHIKENPDLQSSHFVREIFEKEIYQDKELQNNIPTNISVLNLAFYPDEKGSYNYDVNPTTFSSGINVLGNLQNPASRWAGIMKCNFETSNIESIEFWLMDPFVYDTAHSGGDMYINIGEISEDILKDSRKSFENGLPTTSDVVNVDTTIWGRIPKVQSMVTAFDNDEAARPFQDVGLDGLRDEDERLFFSSTNFGAYNYLQSIAINFGFQSIAYTNAYEDPSNDNFHYFRGSDYDEQELGILDRYKRFNLHQGNSPTDAQSNENYQTVASVLPDIEDINRNKELDTLENYYQYLVSIKPDSMNLGINYIDDTISYNAKLKNGTLSWVKWYHFSIPINQYQKKVGDINDFKNIKFIRLFLKGFEKEIILRFATLDFVTAFNEILETPSNIEANRLIVYPNPNDGNCKVYMENKGFREIQLFNISGIEIPIINNLIISNHYSKYLSLNELPKGIYIIKAFDQFDNSYQEKIVVY